MHPTLGRLRYQSGRATLSVIGSTAAATANSTPPYTVSPSPNSAVRVWGRLTLPNALPPATPRPRRSGPCAAVSAMRCTDDCRPMRLLELAWAASHEPLLDTGAIDRAGPPTATSERRPPGTLAHPRDAREQESSGRYSWGLPCFAWCEHAPFVADARGKLHA